MEALLQVRDLNVHYRSGRAGELHAVAGISFDIAPGEILGLMGESGGGKTSVAMALLGLLPKDRTNVSGSVRFQGQELLSIDERSFQKIRGAGISLVFQEPGIALDPVMRAGDQVAEVLHAHRDWSWSRCHAEAESMLARVGLSETGRICAAYPHQLSGGQRQRVVLAQALVCQPALLIADEPTASLDARSQADFLRLLRELKEQLGLSLLLISHTPEIQASLADRLLVMAEGRIVEQGSFAQLYERPAHPCSRAMLRRNRPAGTRESSDHETAAEELLVR
jgi:ABC-type glutathione transport system ATPase component